MPLLGRNRLQNYGMHDLGDLDSCTSLHHITGPSKNDKRYEISKESPPSSKELVNVIVVDVGFKRLSQLEPCLGPCHDIVELIHVI